MKCLLGYYFPSERYSLKAIGRLLGKEDEKMVYPVQIANVFSDLGFEVRYRSCYDLEEFLGMSADRRKDEYVRCYGGDAELLLRHTDTPLLESHIRNALKKGIVVKEPLDFDSMKENFDSGYSAICLINIDLYLNRENKHNGHYIVLTDITECGVSYHEVGPVGAMPNKEVSRNKFLDVWNQSRLFDEHTVLLKPRSVLGV